MSPYRIGSTGDEVRRIQEKLQLLGLYGGPLDGAFGGGAEAAVRLFQEQRGLESDGKVGPQSWQALFGSDLPANNISGRSLDYRCLALTGAFETDAPFPDCFSGLSGDFDGQGISLGVCQWNFGQGSLQPLLKRLCSEYPETARALFHDDLARLTALFSATKGEQLAFARSIQDPIRKRVNEPWGGRFKALGRSDQFQRIQADAAATLFGDARRLCGDYGLWSQRGVALMFDIKVQNGSIGTAVQERIREEFRGIATTLSPEEQETTRLRIVANRRAEAANARWVEEVRKRKLCIADGRGTVHGIEYDLEEQFGIGLGRF